MKNYLKKLKEKYIRDDASEALNEDGFMLRMVIGLGIMYWFVVYMIIG